LIEEYSKVHDFRNASNYSGVLRSKRSGVRISPGAPYFSDT
jgi:hypothetical protein